MQYKHCFYILFRVLSRLKRLTTVHARIHTPTAVSTPQGDRQLVRSSQGEGSRSGTPRHSARRTGDRTSQPYGYKSTLNHCHHAMSKSSVNADTAHIQYVGTLHYVGQ